ncbi:MAG: DUF6512 family protein [Actinomycetota bacterium]|nr:DUF6512 family protein [Actinomycetota bacterium]
MIDQKPGKKKILAWEMSGILFIIILGSAFHFIFELRGGLRIAALLVGFWSAGIWAVIEFFPYGKKTGNFLMAKGVSFTLLSILIAVIYYISEAAGIEGFMIHAVNFFVSIAIAQSVSYGITITRKYRRLLNIAGSLLIVINIAAFSLLTYFPFSWPLFRDPITGGFGIF